MKVETYQRNPGGGVHWRVRADDGRIIEESSGAFYSDRGDPHEQALIAARKLYARSGVELELNT